MNIEIPGDSSADIARLISDGKFGSVEELVVKGLRLVLLQEKLHEAIQDGIDDLDAGNRIPAASVYAAAKHRISPIKRKGT